MTDEPENLGAESVASEGYMQPTRRRLKLRCLRCKKIYYSKPFVVMPLFDPPCPKRACVVEREVETRLADEERMRKIVEEQRAPAHGGANAVNRAIDFTAEETMRAYKLTNLNDNIREGESMAPKLPAAQQAAADNMFNSQAVAKNLRARNPRLANRIAQLGQMATVNGGAALRNSSANIGKIQAAAARPGDRPFQIVPESNYMVRAIPK